jgi:hypothetical protein
LAEKDGDLIIERYPRICGGCKHLNAEDATCAAFPKGIPDEIFWDGEDHRAKRAGQKNDVVFELAEGGEDELAYYERFGQPKSKVDLAAQSLLDLIHDRG